VPASGAEQSPLIPMRPIPESLRHFFVDVPNAPVERRHSFITGRPHFDVSGTTWMNDTLSIASASFHPFWEQARGLIAYWVIPSWEPATLKLRFLHDGKDFSSAWGRHEQKGSKIVSAIGLLTDRGSMHPSFDRPKDGVFRAKSFRIVYELNGKNASIRQLDEKRFEMAAGPVQAIVHITPESRFDGKPIRWITEQKQNYVALIGICYEGDERAFAIEKMNEIKIATGLELLQNGESPSNRPLVFVTSSEKTEQDGPYYGIEWEPVTTESNAKKPLLVPLRPSQSR
ncbi:MAG: hypothetical protein ACRCUY_14015, partial [Thermoguttaceae bacterium]